MDAELFRPTLQDPTPGTGERPWRLNSQFYLAFFGGVLPVTWIAWKNAERLGMSGEARRRIVRAGVAVVLVAGVLCGALIGWRILEGDPRSDALRWGRHGMRVAALIFAYWLTKVQTPADRRWAALHEREGDGAYASMWGPGFLSLLWGFLHPIPVLLGFGIGYLALG